MVFYFPIVPFRLCILNLKMMRKIFCCILWLSTLFTSAQDDSLRVNIRDSLPLADSFPLNIPAVNPVKKEPVYKLKPLVDIPVFAVGAGWSSYAFTKIYSKDSSTAEKVLSLDKNDINGFDRWAVRPYSEKYGTLSNYVFYGSMGLPFLFLIGKETRKDFFKLGFLYLEAMSITGLLYTGSVYFNDRYRPYAYSEETPMPWRTRGGAKNSFYAGHVALVATSTFFMAKVYCDYYPDSKIKWLMYTIAGATTGTITYFRHRGGFHFPTDLLLGVTQGTLTGILVPHFHKNPLIKDPNLSVIPYSSGRGGGIALTYKLR